MGGALTDKWLTPFQGLLRQGPAHGFCCVALDAPRHAFGACDRDLAAIDPRGPARKSGLGDNRAAALPDFVSGWRRSSTFDVFLRCDPVGHCVTGHVVGTKVLPVNKGGVSCIVPAVAVAAVISVTKAVAVAVPESMFCVAPTPRWSCVPAHVSA